MRALAVVKPARAIGGCGSDGRRANDWAATAPVLAGMLLGRPEWSSLLLFAAGGLKIDYDLLLYRGFIGANVHCEEPGARG